MSHPAILIIEDEPAIADTLLYALATEGFSPRWAGTASEGLAALLAQPFALLVLDVGLPDANGFELCKQLRASGHQLPIVFLTSRASEIDRIVGLEIGGDDYLVKPFSPRELTARIKVILRRVAPGTATTPPLPPLPPAAHPENVNQSLTKPPVPGPATSAPFPPPATPHSGSALPGPAASRGASPFTHDELRCRIAYLGRPLELTRIEYRLLKTFLGQPGRVFTREQLLASAWDEPEASLDRTVDAHVKTLRAKLRAVAAGDTDADPIVTHRGLGYSLRE
jgi:two-component system catabolic regulation response regulator CreB